MDFGATDGPMTDEQIAAVKGNVLHIPTVLGAVVVTYNLPGAGRAPAQVRRRDPGRHLPGPDHQVERPPDRRAQPGREAAGQDIIVVHRSDGSGTTLHLHRLSVARCRPTGRRRSGSATSVDWPVGLGGKGNEGVTQQVKQSDGAIGYVELIYAISNELPYADVKNAAGQFVEPSLKSVTRGRRGRDLPPDTDFRVSITNAAGRGGVPDLLVHLAPGPAREPGRGQGGPIRGLPRLDARAARRSGWRPTCTTRRCRCR